MAERATDNGPAMSVMRALGYEFCFLTDRDDEQAWVTPQGRRETFKIQKRRGASGVHGRHLVGIAYRSFSKVDNFVFWADGEKFLLIIPSARLREYFDAEDGYRKVVRTQWHTNIYFDRGGLQYIRPVRRIAGDDDEYDVSEYGHLVPEDLRRPTA